MNKRYAVLLTENAQKDLKRLKDLRGKALKSLLPLAEDPFKGHVLQGSLKGCRSLEFALPGGAYRAAYYVDEEKAECIVFLIGPHEGFYEIAVRRAKSIK